jgi:hypothetical protein
MIKSANVVIAKLKSGQQLCRGNFGGWRLYRGEVKVGQVISKAAQDAIDSGLLVRVDDRKSVAGETWASR